MLKISIREDFSSNNLKHVLKIMKLSFIFIFIFILGIHAETSFSQEATLSLKMKNVSIKNILSEIEKETGFIFIYNNNVKAEIEKDTDIIVDSKSLTETLNILFSKTELSFEILDKQVVIYKNSNNKETIEPASENQNKEYIIRGTVADINSEPLVGATIVIKDNPAKGTVTDAYGNYEISIPDQNTVLVFRYIGYIEKEELVGKRTILNVILEEEIDLLDEVVVVGYGSVKKSDLTGSVATVKGEMVNAFPNVNVQNALQGRVSGVHIQRGSGMPGSTMQIRIRGTSSIKGGSEPLWVIDGFPGDPATLNTADIESIEILKDASATAIYGSRGSNGVIIITTKQAKVGKITVEYNGSLGFANQIKKLDLMNASEYLQFMNEQQKINTGNDFYTPEQIAAAGKGTDWQDLVFRTAKIHNHSINIGGGNEMMQASFGAAFYDQEGIIRGNEIKKYSLRSNINMKLSRKVKLSSNIIYGHTNWDKNDSSGTNRLASVIGSILGAPATIKPYTEDGKYSLMTTDFLTGGLNPIAYINEASKNYYTHRITANVALDYSPIKELTIKIAGNVFNANDRENYYLTTKYPGSNGQANITFAQTSTLNSSNTITYDNTFAKNNHLTVMVGATFDQSESKGAGLAGRGFMTDDSEVYNIGSALERLPSSSSYSKWTMLSFLGRINYSYKSKYLATFNMRADGSSRYSPGNKWGYFPSGALAWRMSEESFMKDIPFISGLKWRVGYGVTGNTAISPYATLDLISSGSVVFDKDLVTFYRMGDTYQSALKWETSRQFDLGVDLSLFNNRIRLTADYYIKKTSDLLSTIEMPRSSGYTTSTQNIGSLQNKGFEIQMDADILDGDFKWDVNAHASFNRNKVLNLYQNTDIYGSTQDIVIMKDPVNIIREGEPIGVFYGYVENGYDDKGMVQYKDLDEDGNITALDRQIIGNPYPDCVLGFNTKVAWKNLSLSCFLYASIGNDIYSLSMAALAHDYQWGISTLKEVLYDHWTPDNPNAKYPNITAAASGNLRMSDRFVYNASYLRMKNLELAYKLPFKQKHIQRADIYFSVQNLFTITDYPFWDVEVNAQGGASSINQGIDAYNYPGNKSYTVGVRMLF